MVPVSLAIMAVQPQVSRPTMFQRQAPVRVVIQRIVGAQPRWIKIAKGSDTVGKCLADIIHIDDIVAKFLFNHVPSLPVA